MQNEADQDSDRPKLGDVRGAARRALLQLMEPLAGFVADSGLSAGELQSIFREAAVRCAAAKQLEASDRVNISGIAATTGISRANVSRILKVTRTTPDGTDDGQLQSTNSILAGWHEDPKFTGPSGLPADLKLYGRGATFDALAKKYGRGIPTRAVLDELMRGGAVELLATQKARARAYIAVERGMSARVIKMFGERAGQLLSTMLLNMRQPERPSFIAAVSEASISPGVLPLTRKEVAVKGAGFLADVRESLARSAESRTPLKSRRGESARVSVTIFYHEARDSENTKRTGTMRRRNFRRGG